MKITETYMDSTFEIFEKIPCRLKGIFGIYILAGLIWFIRFGYLMENHNHQPTFVDAAMMLGLGMLALFALSMAICVVLDCIRVTITGKCE